ncbi:hypothetical protein THASP1DRAFT_30996, partial [Thamnocephalis sphaerospora]
MSVILDTEQTPEQTPDGSQSGLLNASLGGLHRGVHGAASPLLFPADPTDPAGGMDSPSTVQHTHSEATSLYNYDASAHGAQPSAPLNEAGATGVNIARAPPVDNAINIAELQKLFVRDTEPVKIKRQSTIASTQGSRLSTRASITSARRNRFLFYSPATGAVNAASFEEIGFHPQIAEMLRSQNSSSSCLSPPTMPQTETPAAESIDESADNDPKKSMEKDRDGVGILEQKIITQFGDLLQEGIFWLD